MKYKIQRYMGSSADWDNLLLTFPDGNFLQSSIWNDILLASEKARGIRIIVKNTDSCKIVAIAQIIIRKRKVISQDNHKYRYFKKFIPTVRYAEMLDGPVFAGVADELIANILDALLMWIIRYCKWHGIVQFRNNGLSKQSRYLNMVNLPYRELHFIETEWATYLVNLRPTPEELWMLVDHAVRKNVKKAREYGIIIKLIENYDQYIDKFVKPYQKIESLFGREAPRIEVFEAMWTQGKSAYSFFVALDENHNTVGTLGVYGLGEIATEITSTVHPEMFTKKIPVQDLLHWEVLLTMKEKDYEYFDLSGINPNPDNPKEDGIRRFKAKWRGSYIEYSLFKKNIYYHNK